MWFPIIPAPHAIAELHLWCGIIGGLASFATGLLLLILNAGGVDWRGPEYDNAYSASCREETCGGVYCLLIAVGFAFLGVYLGVVFLCLFLRFLFYVVPRGAISAFKKNKGAPA